MSKDKFIPYVINIVDGRISVWDNYKKDIGFENPNILFKKNPPNIDVLVINRHGTKQYVHLKNLQAEYEFKRVDDETIHVIYELVQPEPKGIRVKFKYVPLVIEIDSDNEIALRSHNGDYKSFKNPDILEKWCSDDTTVVVLNRWGEEEDIPLKELQDESLYKIEKYEPIDEDRIHVIDLEERDAPELLGTVESKDEDDFFEAYEDEDDERTWLIKWDDGETSWEKACNILIEDEDIKELDDVEKSERLIKKIEGEQIDDIPWIRTEIKVRIKYSEITGIICNPKRVCYREGEILVKWESSLGGIDIKESWEDPSLLDFTSENKSVWVYFDNAGYYSCIKLLDLILIEKEKNMNGDYADVKPVKPKPKPQPVLDYDDYDDEKPVKRKPLTGATTLTGALSGTNNIKPPLVVASQTIVEGKEENMLSEIFGSIEFGEVADAKLTLQGNIAVKVGDKWKSYNDESGNIVDSTGFLLEAKGMILKLPVQEVEEGDIICKEGKYFFVKSVKENNQIVAINISEGTLDTLLPEVNMLEMTFYVKIVNLMGFAKGSEMATNPMMMYMLSQAGKSDKSDSTNMLMAMMMMNNSNGEKDMFKNQMMLPLLMKDSSASNLPMLMMMMGGMKRVVKKERR